MIKQYHTSKFGTRYFGQSECFVTDLPGNLWNMRNGIFFMSALQARGKKAAICNLISPQIMEHIAFSTFELWNFC